MSNEPGHEPIVVYACPKNSREELVASLTSWRGYDLAELRVYVQKDGARTPTKKGLTVSRKMLPQVKEAVDELIAEQARQEAA